MGFHDDNRSDGEYIPLVDKYLYLERSAWEVIHVQSVPYPKHNTSILFKQFIFLKYPTFGVFFCQTKDIQFGYIYYNLILVSGQGWT